MREEIMSMVAFTFIIFHLFFLFMAFTSNIGYLVFAIYFMMMYIATLYERIDIVLDISALIIAGVIGYLTIRVSLLLLPLIFIPVYLIGYGCFFRGKKEVEHERN